MRLLTLLLACFLAVSCGAKKIEEIGKTASFPVIQKQKMIPILRNREVNEVLQLNIVKTEEQHEVKAFTLEILNGEHTGISKVQIFKVEKEGKKTKSILFGESQKIRSKMTIRGHQELSGGSNNFIVSIQLKKEVSLLQKYKLSCSAVNFGTETVKEIQKDELKDLRVGIGIRQAGDDNIAAYRIPGLATTNKGTLIGVYDIRRNNSVDLQEDIDVGMNRSTDGGQTWEPMKIIMDMGEWGGLPNDQNGIGDPAVLVDRSNNTIWVAAVWAHGHPGKRNWWASKPGMTPEQTSQFVLVKSEDDGKTWSDPINITEQIKDKEWYLLLQGPGKGITMKDGTLVFPAQFKDKDQMPHSTIIWSKDHGKTWTIGTGAKSNTTEAQVIELGDGSLMLNMRDNRNRKDKSETNGRAIAITKDLGKTWTTHSTSNSKLIEPTCMASLIKEEFQVGQEKKELVLFSNPNSKTHRKNMSIKVSFDDANSWPEKFTTLLDAEGCWGYSCMTKIDDNTVGILYEGSQAHMVFQMITIEELVSKKK